MNQELKKGILLLILGLTPIILFASTFSVEVWSYGNYLNEHDGQADFTIPPPNFLLGDRYHLIAGDYFSSYSGYIHGFVAIYNKATGENNTYTIYIDASTPYVSWDSQHIVLILLPGDYTLYWHTDIGIDYYIYSQGWFMLEHDEPREVNQLQVLITIVTGFIGLFITILAIRIISSREKMVSGHKRNKQLTKDERLMEKLEQKRQRKADKKSN